MRTPWDLPATDLEAVVERCRTDLATLRGTRILVTGGTGALGSWLVGSLSWAERRLGLGLRLEVLSRSPQRVPLPEGPTLRVLAGDVSNVRRLTGGAYDVIIHGAAASAVTAGVGEGEAGRMAATVVDGTRAVLEVAARNRARVLFLSSGAVYGAQRDELVGEEAPSGPDPMDPFSVYGQAKRLAETLGAAATAAGSAEVVVGRLFSFLGPRLPLDAHFAAGNFLADAGSGRDITVKGDGRTVRSYLYTGDLPEWCWALLARGRPGRAYNVGSDRPVTIAELARTIATSVTPPVDVLILGRPQPGPAPRYVPDISRARAELGLAPRTALADATSRTLAWLRANGTLPSPAT